MWEFSLSHYLLAAQCGIWVDAGCAAGGEVAGGHGDARQKDRGYSENQRIGGTDIDEQTGGEARYIDGYYNSSQKSAAVSRMPCQVTSPMTSPGLAPRAI